MDSNFTRRREEIIGAGFLHGASWAKEPQSSGPREPRSARSNTLSNHFHFYEGTFSCVLEVDTGKISLVPSYQNPLRNLSDDEIERLKFPPASEFPANKFSLEGEYGPAMFKELLWVGRISEAVLKVRKWNPESRDGAGREIRGSYRKCITARSIFILRFVVQDLLPDTQLSLKLTESLTLTLLMIE